MIIAPDADADARRILAAKKNLRLLIAGGLPDPRLAGLTYKTVSGGFLVQTRDNGRVTRAELKIVTKRQPSETELADMLFAFTVGKHVKSNTIVYAKDLATAGIGAGQMSRVIPHASPRSRRAMRRSRPAKRNRRPSDRRQPRMHSSPSPTALETIAEAGATSVIQPGGSIRDGEVIEAADKAGLAMAFTGMRHFRH